MDGGVTIEIDGNLLRRYVEPIEELMGQRKKLNREITATYRKAKEAGFQTPILRTIISERALDHQVWSDQQRLLQSYRDALGMYVDTPLGEAAMARAEDKITDNVVAIDKPKPFAEQLVHPRRRRVPRKVLFDADHPQGTA